MSELKATTVYDVYWKANSVGEGTGILVYLKSEADKVIAELEEKITRLENIRRVHIEAVTSMEAGLQQEAKSIRHANYKRCLAMAKWCESEENRLEAISPIFDTDRECWEYGSDYWNKWHKRWLELAKQFKEADK